MIFAKKLLHAIQNKKKTLIARFHFVFYDLHIIFSIQLIASL